MNADGKHVSPYTRRARENDDDDIVNDDDDVMTAKTAHAGPVAAARTQLVSPVDARVDVYSGTAPYSVSDPIDPTLLLATRDFDTPRRLLTDASPLRSDAAPRRYTARWNKREWDFPEPPRCDSPEECLRALQEKSHLDDTSVLPAISECLAKIRGFYTALQALPRRAPDASDAIWQPTTLTTCSGPGLYIGRIRNTQPVYGKIGQSTGSRYDRVKLQCTQKRLWAAAGLLSARECLDRVPQTLVSDIVALQPPLPALAWHPTNRDRLSQFIAVQIMEGYYNCAYKTLTNNILEGILAQPSATVRSIMTVPDATYPAYAHAVRLCRDHPLPNGGLHGILTWITEKSTLMNLAQQSTEDPHCVLRRFMPPAPPGLFVNRCMLQDVYGPKFGAWEDAIKVAPRATQIERVARALAPLLAVKDSSLDGDAIRDALEPLRGANYSHYVRPSPRELAHGTRSVLQRKLRDPTVAWLEMERVGWQSLMVYHPEWLATVVDLESMVSIEGVTVGLTQTDPPRVLQVLPSFFLVCAPETPMRHRVNAMRGLLLALQLQFDSGNVTPQEYHALRHRVCSFLMALEGLSSGDDDDSDADRDALNDDDDDGDGDDDDEGDTPCQHQDLIGMSSFPRFHTDHFAGSWRRAALNFLPKGHLCGATRRVRGISNGVLRVGQMEGLHLRKLLGREMFQKLLVAHGVKSLICPFEVDYRCAGLPDVDDAIPHRPCTCTTPNEVNIVFVGSRIGPSHGLRGHFMCAECLAHKGNERRERVVLRNLPAPTQEQTDRLDALQERVVQHAQCVRDGREYDIGTRGLEAVQLQQRIRNQGHQQRQNTLMLHDSEEGQVKRAALQKRKRQEEATRQAQGKKKKSGIHRGSKKKITYPKPVQDLMSRAARELVAVSGKRTIETNCIFGLLDLILVDQYHQGNLGDHEIEVLSSGPKPYFEHAYVSALDGILEKASGKGGRNWRVLEPQVDGPRVIRGLTDKDLARRVFDALDPLT